jgi:parallel beta-helix repeat protein
MSASDPVVVNNDLRDNVTGISMAGGSPTLEGNTVTGGTTGIVIGAGTSARLSGNTVCDNEVNMRLVDGVDVAGIADNDICPDEAVEASE